MKDASLIFYIFHALKNSRHKPTFDWNIYLNKVQVICARTIQKEESKNDCEDKDANLKIERKFLFFLFK